MSLRTLLFAWFLVSRAAFAQDTDPWRPAFDACRSAYARHDLDAAEKRCSEALVIARGESPPGLRVALSTNSLGVVYLDQGRLHQARAPFYESLGLFEQVAPGPNEHFVSLLTNIGDLELRTQHPAVAEKHLRLASSLVSQLEPPAPQLASRCTRFLVASLCAQGNRTEASALGAPLGISCTE